MGWGTTDALTPLAPPPAAPTNDEYLLGLAALAVKDIAPNHDQVGAYSSVAVTGTTAEPRTCFALPAGTLKELVAFFPFNTLTTPLLLEFGPVGLPAIATVSVPPGATGFFSTGPIAVPVYAGGWRWHAVTAPFAGAHVVSIVAGARFKPT